MIAPPVVLSLHNAITWFLVGLIWVVQLVHYPLFDGLDATTFRQSHAFHSRRILWIVGPAMLSEFGLSAYILFERGLSDGPAAAGLGLVLFIWVVTAFIMVPIHQRLERSGFRPEIHRALVRWNWLPTLAWSARGAICLLWLQLRR
jgi:hypothetical protein